MPINEVQSAKGTTSATFGSGTTSGNTIFCWVLGTSVTAPSGFSLVGSVVIGGVTLYCFIFQSVTGGLTTIAPSSGSVVYTIIQEFSGVSLTATPVFTSGTALQSYINGQSPNPGKGFGTTNMDWDSPSTGWLVAACGASSQNNTGWTIFFIGLNYADTLVELTPDLHEAPAPGGNANTLYTAWVPYNSSNGNGIQAGFSAQNNTGGTETVNLGIFIVMVPPSTSVPGLLASLGVGSS